MKSVLWRLTGIPIVTVAACLVLRWIAGFWIGELAPLNLFYLAMIASSVWGGAASGLITTVIGTLAGMYFFMPPRFNLMGKTQDDLIRITSFVVVGMLMSLASARLNTLRIRSNQIAEALRQSEARFRRLWETDVIGVFYWKLDGTVLDGNDAYLKITGYSREELQSHKINWQTMTPPEYRERDDHAVQQQKTIGHDTPFEKEYLRKDGTRIWVQVSGAMVTDTRGIAYCMDINARKRAEIERDQLLEAERTARTHAERANRIKDEFLATVSHELRTPLNAVMGWAQILRRNHGNDDSVKEGIEIIERNARSQARLIEDLLDMSRIMSGKVKLDLRMVQVGNLVNAAVDSMRPAAELKQVALFVSPLDPHMHVRGDATRLQQIFWNLLSNAVKFTPRGGEIRVSIEPESEHVNIRVSDSGIGIPADFLPFVFDRFRQADASTTRKFGGLGLGLSIVKHLVELHGGDIRVESAGENRGSSFIITLPTLHIESMTRDDVAQLHGQAIEHNDVPLKGVKVLAVDDEADARKLISHILTESGATVTAVECADDAITAMKHSQPHVLISDIGMPGTDGLEFLRKVRLLPATVGGSTPAIALTAFARPEDRARALLAGYQLHIAKPVDSSELLSSVAMLANVSREADSPRKS